MRTTSAIIFAVALLIAGVAWGNDGGAPAKEAAKGAAPAAKRTLRVGLVGSKPFILPTTGAPRGVAVDVWNAVETEIGVSSKYSRFKRVAQALAAVEAGTIDIAVGPISITAQRAQRIDFTQPYFASSIGILTSSTPQSAWAKIKPFVSTAFMVGVGTLLLVLFVVGNLVWLAERRANSEHFPSGYPAGVANGMWFALVTMTTVGYGDRAPITKVGRVITSIWMLVAMIGASSLTATIATALTVSQMDGGGLSSLNKLRRRRVAVVKGTPGVALARRYGARLQIVVSKEEALELTGKRKVDAMLYDLPILQFYVEENPTLPLTTYSSNSGPDNYGFAVSKRSPLRNSIDVALLRLREKRVLLSIWQRWSIRPGAS